MAFKEDIEASARWGAQTELSPEAKVKKSSKQGHSQLGPELKTVSMYGLQMIQEMDQKQGK